MSKRGVFFTLDAILAAGIIVLVIVFLSSTYVREPQREHISYISQDTLRVLTNIEIEDFDNAYTQTLIEENIVVRPNNTILEQIGEFWAEGDTELAANFSEEVADALIPERFGFGVYVNGEEIYVRNKTITRNLVSSRKIITGIAKEKPTFGFSSRAFLKKISSKTTYSYSYFGGFVGQGNLSREIEDIPSDATIRETWFEASAGRQFNIYINGNFCSTLTPTSTNLTTDVWNLTSCNSDIVPGGSNNFSLEFPTLMNESFIAGGFLKVEYTTEEFSSNDTTGIQQYKFPGISGLINLFSAINLPGTLQAVSMQVHFYNNKSTYLVIGNETIFETGGSSTDQVVNISSLSLPLSSQTIPIRMGSRNISESFNTTSGEPSDTVLVTDVSGSMDDCAVWGFGEMCTYDCYWWIFYQGGESCSYTGTCAGDQCNTGCSGGFYWTDNHAVQNTSSCTSTKMDLAKDAGLDFVDYILNISGNEIGLVSYDTNVDSTEAITDIALNLQNEINSYSPGSATCICCGINSANTMLSSSTDRPFIVVMSDGQENRYCSSYTDTTGSGSGSIDAIDAGQNACNNNITVFSVGFGADADQDTLKQVACNESFYFNASNASSLTSVYQAIGEQIIIIANFSSQVVTVAGDFQNSELYSDSFIQFNFTPTASSEEHAEIELTRETDKFNSCTPTVNIPNASRIVDAQLVSYSGSHWTSYVGVNGNTVFNISDFGNDYRDIGDPFVLSIPVNYLQFGDNLIEMETADDPTNSTGCSYNNSMVYTIAISSAIDYGAPKEKIDGCAWDIALENGGNNVLLAPSGYSGPNSCYYNSSGSEYNQNDTYDVAVIGILQQLDFDSDGLLDIDFDSDDLELEYITISDVPSLWGPSIVEIRVWE